MNETFQRTVSLIGEEALGRLRQAHVCVAGLGGVGGMAAEALARAGIGEITLIDGDTAQPSNINRQIVALRSNIGRNKAAIMGERILDMHPETRVHIVEEMLSPDYMPLPDCDFIVDAIDMVSAKIALIAYAKAYEIPIISCMGTGNRLRPDAFRVDDIEKTEYDPLARVMRRELKQRGLTAKVVWSTEIPAKTGARTPASIAFVPPAAGLLLAAHVIEGLLHDPESR